MATSARPFLILRRLNQNRIKRKPGVTEEVLRTWFGDTLITSDGVRAPVYRREFETGGLPNAAVDKLEEIRLIKAESRGINVRWYELAHDRFIEPIRRSNENGSTTSHEQIRAGDV